MPRYMSINIIEVLIKASFILRQFVGLVGLRFGCGDWAGNATFVCRR
jgi:hypothetical protein